MKYAIAAGEAIDQDVGDPRVFALAQDVTPGTDGSLAHDRLENLFRHRRMLDDIGGRSSAKSSSRTIPTTDSSRVPFTYVSYRYLASCRYRGSEAAELADRMTLNLLDGAHRKMLGQHDTQPVRRDADGLYGSTILVLGFSRLRLRPLLKRCLLIVLCGLRKGVWATFFLLVQGFRCVLLDLFAHAYSLFTRIGKKRPRRHWLGVMATAVTRTSRTMKLARDDNQTTNHRFEGDKPRRPRRRSSSSSSSRGTRRGRPSREGGPRLY